MANEKTRLEIGHVLFIDVVGYSKLLLKQQSETKPGLKRFWSEYQHAFDDPFRSYVTNKFEKKSLRK